MRNAIDIFATVAIGAAIAIVLTVLWSLVSYQSSVKPCSGVKLAVRCEAAAMAKAPLVAATISAGGH